MTSRTDEVGTTTYQYNAKNRLIGINKPDGEVITYRYDPLGRRIEKNINGTITRYFYDGQNILYELDGSNTILARYTHGPGIDEPLIMERDAANYYYHADGLGSITHITNASGNIVQSYVYSAFGEIVDQEGNLLNPYTYTGREYDPESGLYYYRARFYDPEVGRFISKDPIGFWGGDLNLYAYVGNNPVNWVDPSGELFSPVGAAVGGIVGGISGGIIASFGPNASLGSIATAVAVGAAGGAIGGLFDVSMGAAAGLGAGIGAGTAVVNGSNIGGIIGGAMGGAIGGAFVIISGGGTAGVATGAFIGAWNAWLFEKAGNAIYNEWIKKNACSAY